MRRPDHFHAVLEALTPEGNYELEIEGGWLGFPSYLGNAHFLLTEWYLLRLCLDWGGIAPAKRVRVRRFRLAG